MRPGSRTLYLPRWIRGNRIYHREHGRAWQDEAKRSIESWLHLPVTRCVAPGERANGTELIFHDRDFVLNWAGSMKKLMEALR